MLWAQSTTEDYIRAYLKSEISVRELVSTLKKKKRRRGMNCRTFSQNTRTRGKSHHHHQACPKAQRSIVTILLLPHVVPDHKDSPVCMANRIILYSSCGGPQSLSAGRGGVGESPLDNGSSSACCGWGTSLQHVLRCLVLQAAERTVPNVRPPFMFQKRQ